MKDRCHLILNRHGIKRMTKGSGQLRVGEISVAVDVEVPNELFIRPTITASIHIDPSAVPPVNFDAGVLEAVEDNIRNGLGVEVQLNVIEPEKEGEAS